MPGYLEADRILALDFGLGLSMIWWKPEQPQRVQYLMLSDENYAIYPQPEQLIHLMDVLRGAVYRNAVTACTQS